MIKGERLRQARQISGYTLDALEKKSGVSRSTIGKLETGYPHSPLLVNIEALADTLDVSLDWLCGRER